MHTNVKLTGWTLELNNITKVVYGSTSLRTEDKSSEIQLSVSKWRSGLKLCQVVLSYLKSTYFHLIQVTISLIIHSQLYVGISKYGCSYLSKDTS